MKRTLSRHRSAHAVLATCLVVAPVVASAEEPRRPPTAEEFARLEREVHDQRELIMQMLQIEQQRYDLLLKLIANGGGPAPAAAGKLPELPKLPGASASPAEPAVHARTATLSGTVDVRGERRYPVFVYVEDVVAPPARGHALQIAQKDKQFEPQVSVVQRGTRVVFPNVDKVAHNVFSQMPKQPFDLGMAAAGERGSSVTLTTPGVFEVYCNIHAKMWAEVLVVPGALWTKVEADGSFKLPNVPVGKHTVVVWTAHAQPVRATVNLAAGGGQAQLALDAAAARPHNNKFGQPYGSYQE